MLLAYFSVGFLNILVQKVIFLILTHNPWNYVENMQIQVKMAQITSQQQCWVPENDNISPLWWHQELQYHWWVPKSTIFRYPDKIFEFPKYDQVINCQKLAQIGSISF